MKELAIEQETAMAQEVLELLAGKDLSIRQARYILERAETLLDSTKLTKPVKE